MDSGLGIEGGLDGLRNERWDRDQGWKVGQMDTGLGMEGGTDGHRTRDERWDRWTQD